MPLSFPRTDFATVMKVAEQEFRLQRYDETSNTATGPQAKELAPPRWVVTYSTPQLRHADAMTIEALLDSLEAGQTVELGDRRREFAAAYGQGVAGDSGAVGARDPDNSLLRITGLAANFIASVGDYVQINRGSLRYLHRCLEAVTANGSGTIGAITVAPRLAAGVVVGDVVSFRTPRARFALVPGSVSIRSTKVYTSIQFRMEQVFR